MAAIEWIKNGFTFDQWMDHQLDLIADSSPVCNGDKLDKRRDLEAITQEVLSLL